jgi:hypothetical protein
MQATTRLHNGVANAVLQETDFVFDNPRAFHSTNRVFNADPDRRDRAIGRFLRRGEFSPRRFFLRLDDGDPIEDEALETHILVEATAMWQGITLQFSQVFIVCLPFIGGTQEADVTALINHEEVFDRVALLLATVEFLLILGIDRAVDRSLRAVMPKRGG